MSTNLDRFRRYPKLVLAVKLAELAERPDGARIADDLKQLSEFYDQAGRKTRFSPLLTQIADGLPLDDDAPECGVGKDDPKEADERAQA